MNTLKYIQKLFIAILLGSLLFACEVEEISMPDYEVGIIADAEITPGKYWFDATDLANAEIEFALGYEGFEVHQAQEIELYISKSNERVLMGTYTSFPSTITLSAEEAYGYFNETIADYDNDGSGKDEFRFTYTITTTDGMEFSEFGQYYTYNPSLDGRFTGKYAQFYTNLPGFGVLIMDVRTPNPDHPNEN